MKDLLNKELRLAASPLTYLFLVFSVMTLLPGYPILVGAWFVCLGIFYSFQSGREAGDILFTVLLPIPKRDVVRGKFAFVCCVQTAAFLIMAVLTVLRMTVLRNAPIYVQNVMMPANPVFLAFVLLIFAAFNFLFLGKFFQTAYAIGKPFVLFLIAAVLLMGIGETLHHIPGLELLKQYSAFALIAQFVILALAAAAYVLLTLCSLRKSEQNFEALDL